jgi:equilibrative nucleoside transporter 1/2/3
MALGFLIPYQRHLSLRVLVLQPLLITLIMLASTAALVMLRSSFGMSLHSGAAVQLPCTMYPCRLRCNSKTPHYSCHMPMRHATQAVRTELSGDLMSKFTLPSIGLMGLCTAMLQGGTLQLASIFSPTHIRVRVSEGCVCNRLYLQVGEISCNRDLKVLS